MSWVSVVYGRLGGDPVERETRGGKRMVTASVAVDVARYGEPELTEWVSLAAFGKSADALMRHARGELIGVMGATHKRRFTDRNGQEREAWSLTIDSMMSARLIRPGGGRKRSSGSKAATADEHNRPLDRSHAGSDPSDDLPF